MIAEHLVACGIPRDYIDYVAVAAATDADIVGRWLQSEFPGRQEFPKVFLLACALVVRVTGLVAAGGFASVDEALPPNGGCLNSADIDRKMQQCMGIMRDRMAWRALPLLGAEMCLDEVDEDQLVDAVVRYLIGEIKEHAIGELNK